MDEYKVKKNEYSSEYKKTLWDAAIGLQRVDNLSPSNYLLTLSEQNTEGLLEIDEVEQRLHTYYKTADNEETDKTRECDIVSSRIVALLSEGSISLSSPSLKSIHRYLFRDIYDFAGVFRSYNITKDEEVLLGDTVKYANYFEIDDILDYDFSREKEKKYSAMTMSEIVKSLSRFSSSVWQVHPFGEGNTRTTAVFMELYLVSLGFEVNNDMFKAYSKYYRNALVRSNYANMAKKIDVEFCYLERFCENLIAGAKHDLEKEDLTVKSR